MPTAALSHLGDREIRMELVNRRNENPDLAERCIWQIDAQQSQDSLVACVTRNEGIEGPQRQRWAQRRAMELGIDKKLLRQAVLDFAKTVIWTEIRGKKWPDPSLIDLKALALELAVLQPTDLPDVPAPPRFDR